MIKRSRKKFTFIMLSDSNFLSEAKKLNKNFRVFFAKAQDRWFRVQ